MRKLSGASARDLRFAKLQALVESKGAVPLQSAAELLQVSTMTIRRDLAVPGAPIACLGGYVVASLPAGGARYTLDAERDQHAQNKLRACRRAASLVKDGDSLFIDCGTTMPHFAEALPPGIALDIICYSLNIASILIRRPNTQLMILGGLYHASSATLFCDEALHYLRRLGVHKAFISAGGVHPGRGASCSNFNEVPIKQAAMASATESILVVDDSKLGRLRPAFFSPLEAFSHIIVGGAPAPQRHKGFESIKLDIAA